MSSLYFLIEDPIYRAHRGFYIGNKYTPLATATLGYISYRNNFYTKLCLYLALRQVNPLVRTTRQLHPIIEIEARQSPVVQINCNKYAMQCNLTFQLSPVVSVTKEQKLACTALTQKKLSVSVTKQISPFIDLTRNDDCG